MESRAINHNFTVIKYTNLCPYFFRKIHFRAQCTYIHVGGVLESIQSTYSDFERDEKCLDYDL